MSVSMDIKEIYAKWDSINLVYRIIGGLVLGVILALLIPGIGYLSLFGDAFIWALKGAAPVLVLFLIIGALSKKGQNLGKRFKLVISLYIISTIIAAIVAVVMSFAFPVELTLDMTPDDIGDYTTDFTELVSTLLSKILCNPIDAIASGNYLGILFWGIVVGLTVKAVASDTARTLCEDASNVMLKVIRVIINFAPFGIFGLIYNTVSTNGLDIFVEYGELILLIVSSMLIVFFVTNPLIVFLVTKKNPYPLLFRCLRDSAITAFFTRSSAANIPVNLNTCEKMGLDKEFYSVSIPLGATINMDGAAITITVMSLAAAFTLGIEVPISVALLLCIVSTFAACGASGVNGGSLLLIPLACSLLGVSDFIAMQLITIGFIIGVIQDSMETALNSSSDVLFTATAEMYESSKNQSE